MEPVVDAIQTAAATLSDTDSHTSATAWTASQLRSAANITQYAPSAMDLVLAGPRMVMKIGSFAFVTIPEAVDSALGLGFTQRVIPAATTANDMGLAAGGASVTTAVAAAAPEILADTTSESISTRLSMESARSFGNIFGYATSKWALTCVVMAVVLNRTHVYASTRRNLTLGWKLRLALRIAPIAMFAYQAQVLMQSIQCQTSPDFALLRWNNATRKSDLLFTQNGGMLHTVSSVLTLGSSDAQSCRAIGMVPDEYATANPGPQNLTGSLSLLWPLFETLCFSQFVETLSCAVQGRQVAAETGMTLFEHSLAFAEADASASNQLGWGSSGGAKPVGRVPMNLTYNSDIDAAKVAIKRSKILSRLNTPPEVLVVGFISSMNHLTSHILGVFNLQGRLRLISTGFWGLMFMGTLIWSFFSFSIDDDGNHSLLRFPTVCIIGFIPHMLVLGGIVACSIVYGLALLLSAMALPAHGRTAGQSILQRFTTAHQNLQANVPLSSVRINLHMDFYSSLLKVGFNALTMASEAVYLNESKDVTVTQRTWLEMERLQEIENNSQRWSGRALQQYGDDEVADELGLVTSTDRPMDLLRNSTSGFAQERVAGENTTSRPFNRLARDGIGATERSGRWIMAFELFTGIGKLMLAWFATVVIVLFAKVGLNIRPRWLTKYIGEKANKTSNEGRDELALKTLNFWLLGSDGELRLPKDDHVDVEVEIRNRLKMGQRTWGATDEERLNDTLYSWWRQGGWWGGEDNSGDFKPAQVPDEDTTSVVSISTNASDAGWQSDNSNDDGLRTPTQRSPVYSREATPLTDTPLDPSSLARLLNPLTPAQREESRILAKHLSSDTICTRARYQQQNMHERARVVVSTRQRPANFRSASTSGKLTAEEEAQILEYLIITRREAQAGAKSSWAEGGQGMGDDGPQCVVCQSAPRSIIVWPCRCLSLCDDCRVTLAMNNFDKCVCCRQDVNSFSRIFVP